jgi:hypothetical protein
MREFLTVVLSEDIRPVSKEARQFDMKVADETK